MAGLMKEKLGWLYRKPSLLASNVELFLFQQNEKYVHRECWNLFGKLAGYDTLIEICLQVMLVMLQYPVNGDGIRTCILIHAILKGPKGLFRVDMFIHDELTFKNC